jgi:hypothetical protein
MKVVSPTGSYFMTVPEDIEEQLDERVASFWRPGEHVLLQTSSYARSKGPQHSAEDRLKARLTTGRLLEVRREVFSVPCAIESAAASGTDDEGCHWTYIYAVWPDLTVFASISGPPEEINRRGDWAFKALQSLQKSKDD